MRLSRRRFTRHGLIVAAVIVVLIGVGVIVAYTFLDEPLRRYTEAKMNTRLEGYSVSIGKLHFSPVNFSLDLRNLVIVQNAQPDPPVANIERLYASVHWRALLAGRVVGDILIDRPIVVLNLAQAREEIKDPTPVTDKGWQDALQAIYPLKINHLQITRGDVTYQDKGPFKPLRLYDLAFEASNIRNVHSEKGVYPSPMSLSAHVFDAGSLEANGWADFLAEPYAAFMANIKLDAIELDYFKPITNRYNMVVEKGTLSGEGRVEIAPQLTSVKLWTATVDGIKVDYLYTPAKVGIGQEAVQTTERAAEEAQNPRYDFRVDRLHIVKSDFGFVNKTTNPAYRAFLSDTALTITNVSSLPSGETAVAKLTGRFMGTGPASADFRLRPTRPGLDFDLAVKIDDTDLRTMNDMLRAYGKFDVTAGRFSLYTELGVRNRQVSGYVKPLFQDMEVYNPEQDRSKTTLRKLYQGVVGGVSKILQNRSREEVATRVNLSGPLDKPNASILDTIGGLVQNAFFKAILPGFDVERRHTGR